jgi:predicted secreted Zn-dependent protease
VNSRLLLVTIGVVIAAAAYIPTRPEPAVVEKFSRGIVDSSAVKYYDIGGRTPGEVAKSMEQLGAETNGHLGHPRATYRPAWHTIKSADGSCDLTAVRVITVSQPVLPRWTPSADPVPGLSAEWQRFASALEQHEAGHRDITARGAHELLDGMLALKTFCSQVPRDVKRLTDSIAAQTDSRQAAYDALTRDGGSQGAVFLTRLP